MTSQKGWCLSQFVIRAIFCIIFTCGCTLYIQIKHNSNVIVTIYILFSSLNFKKMFYASFKYLLGWTVVGIFWLLRFLLFRLRLWGCLLRWGSVQPEKSLRSWLVLGRRHLLWAVSDGGESSWLKWENKKDIITDV